MRGCFYSSGLSIFKLNITYSFISYYVSYGDKT